MNNVIINMCHPSGGGGGGGFFHDTVESVTLVAGVGSADPDKFRTMITSDGSDDVQTITLGAADPSLESSLFHLFYCENQVADDDFVLIDAADGIVDSESIGLYGTGSWALFMLTASGWLPLCFGGGAEVSPPGNRGLQRNASGGLDWNGVTSPLVADLFQNGNRVLGGDGTGDGGGDLQVEGGFNSSGDGGAAYIRGGQAFSAANGGAANLAGGAGDVNGGAAVVLGGSGSSGNGGAVNISGGSGAVDGGDINLNMPNAGSGRQGLVILGGAGLPTSDPGVSGAIWVYTGNVLKVSP